MSKIRILDDLTIQKIAAGEVIERPSSIVKELVENSLDAKATNIVVEITDGGKEIIRITDDGEGIEEEDINIAFERHSTSKLSKVDDLYNIMTLGFRGEALSSIASVAKVELLTKTLGPTAGIHAIVEEGKIQSINKIGSPKGTTMIVKDLFYNLPVRKKFLRSSLSEANSISDIVNKLALGNYNTSFKYIRDNRVVLKTSGNGNIKENIYTILGKDIANGLIPIEFSDDGIKVAGFISNNNLYRSNRSHQYIYINGRYIVNYSISNAIENQYKSLIPLNRFPVFILYLEINPEDMDINIHPTKQEVKFTNNHDVHNIISNAIRDKLYKSLYIPKFEIAKPDEDTKKDEIQILFNTDEDISQDIIVKDFTLEDTFDKEEQGNNLEINLDIFVNNNEEYLDDVYTIPYESGKPIENILEINPIGVVFGTYILGESKNKEKLFFIDQHAAHERVMYEKFRQEFESEKIHVQQLLSPEIIHLTNSEINELNKNMDIFDKLGFEIEEFGPNSIAIRGVPFLFGEPNIRRLFLDLLDGIESNFKSSYDTKLDKIMKLACTSAIKSGDKISNLEIDALVRDLVKCENPYSCPHGRPTVVEITKRDIEKEFLRIV